jgi:hypothetical protein
MTRTSARFGWRAGRIDDVAEALAVCLSVELEPRHSLYYGDYYLWKEPDGGELVLQENFMEDDGELTAPEYGDYPVFVFASLSDPALLEQIASIDGAERLRER